MVTTFRLGSGLRGMCPLIWSIFIGLNADLTSGLDCITRLYPIGRLARLYDQFTLNKTADLTIYQEIVEDFSWVKKLVKMKKHPRNEWPRPAHFETIFMVI